MTASTMPPINAAAKDLADGLVVEPLERLRLGEADRSARRVVVTDGKGRAYVDQAVDDLDAFLVGGALGWHRVAWCDEGGHPVQTVMFRVTCETRIEDGDAGFGRLLRDLHYTMLAAASGDGQGSAMVEGKLYRFFIRWLRDHTHTLKGMKYFSGDLKSGLELYADTQRADGMVYDRIAPKADVQGWRDHTFRTGDFIRTLNRGAASTYTLQRIPVENDVEFLFVECLYRTWQATGDTAWMARHLDHAIRAVAYCTSDPYRWSETFALLKRGYTIDTWDFMHADDRALTLGDNVCNLQKTTFGVMHGDNTGMAMACRQLAELLAIAGRSDEAAVHQKLGDDLLNRLEALAWDDRGYYRHHVSEDPSFQRDVGDTDETAQVSLSNAYALNRGIGDDKCQAIINTYQRIRKQMPAASPGEFYNIFPPFERGFGHNNDRWQYMNGGVSTIVAGELARGAFAQDEEDYAVDILRRLKGLADRHGGRLHVCFNGNPQTTPPPRSFTPVNLDAVSNVTASHRSTGGWGDPGNDLSQMPTGSVTYHHVPFEVLPDGRGLGLSRDREGYADELRVPVHDKHASMYLLHTASRPGTPTAEIDVVYADGQTERIYITPRQQLENWFMPGSGEGGHFGHAPRQRSGWPAYQLAWQGPNASFENVGIFLWGWDNPRPEVEIREVVFRAAHNGSSYFVPGITFSNHPVWFPQSDLSFGIPDSWGAAAVVYALVEGLAGVVDASHSFETVDLFPRWEAADVERAQVSVTYPACGGYVAYQYHRDPGSGEVAMTVTGSGEEIRARLPRPADRTAKSATVEVNGAVVPAESADGRVTVTLRGPGPHTISIRP